MSVLYAGKAVLSRAGASGVKASDLLPPKDKTGKNLVPAHLRRASMPGLWCSDASQPRRGE
ncbi:hypothetical protein NZJ31_004653 [Salmonella enterica subsp. enterica serovar Kentucky]|nr:hypothetical protein [Salmonella enterica subsp. enterica serovar Kentucky]EDL0179441.1 hypothetical protein [Salmonella enterica subsp. enterica serovar Kentucky]EDL8115367.1 hypothetical protein [Salmonella enterica subsp. enterica serovar Kentucky]EDL8598117.1 hypothetical protein [Salmonella enterica subsp. enterica serovar Kentucky]EDM6059062.1 hypothetical protein [Salmonella enterica subsp. enterica serovar Kentucky]